MKREVAPMTDEGGQLRGVLYHDGLMTRFCLEDGLTFTVRATDGSLTELIMTGLKLLCTDPIWEAAIITDIDLWKASEAPARYWQNLLQGREGRGGLQADIQRYLPQLADFWLVEVGTAFGGGFTCLCENVQVFQTLSDDLKASLP